MARMVCVWLPNWPLQRLLHERPELKGQAVVLFSTAGKRGPRVVASAPRLCGGLTHHRGADVAPLAILSVTVGMPLAEAQALMTGDAHFERHDPAADIAALRELARTCDRFSPQFGIEEAEQADCLLLDIMGCSHLWTSSPPTSCRESEMDNEQNLANAIASHFRQQGFQVRVAIGPTIGAAWGAAHDLATSERQPVLTDDELANVLAPLPVTALRLPRKIVETLHELGLRRIGQLRALPRETFPSRFGPELLKRLDQAFGDAPELLVAERPTEPMAVTWVTDESLTDRESLRLVCRELADDLMDRLKSRRDGVRQLLCQVKGTAARPVELLVSLISPSDSAKHLLELLGLQIDRADLPEGISFVRLEATAIASLATRQRDLFGLEADTDTHREVCSLLDRLSNRLGATAVVHAALVPEAQPELSVKHEPCVLAEGPVAELARVQMAHGSPRTLTSSATSLRQPVPLSPCLSVLARPLRLFAPPQPIDATVAGPEGAPMHFCWDRREHRVIRSWGPERIETGWWRDQSICRDYFRVEVQNGQHFWLFRCFERAAWFIHGAFD